MPEREVDAGNSGTRYLQSALKPLKVRPLDQPPDDQQVIIEFTVNAQVIGLRRRGALVKSMPNMRMMAPYPRSFPKRPTSHPVSTMYSGSRRCPRLVGHHLMPAAEPTNASKASKASKASHTQI